MNSRAGITIILKVFDMWTLPQSSIRPLVTSWTSNVVKAKLFGFSTPILCAVGPSAGLPVRRGCAQGLMGSAVYRGLAKQVQRTQPSKIIPLLRRTRSEITRIQGLQRIIAYKNPCSVSAYQVNDYFLYYRHFIFVVTGYFLCILSLINNEPINKDLCDLDY